MMGHRHLAALMGLGALVACGDATTTPGETPMVTVDRRAPIDAAWLDTTTLSAEGADKTLGIDAEGRVTAVIGGRSFVIEAGELVLRQRFADPGAPDALGEVHRIRPRVAGGAWLATATGLWSTSGLYVRYRPTDLAAAELTDVAEQATGTFAGLWLAAGDGTYWVDGRSAQRIEADHPASRVAVAPDAVALLAADSVRILTSSPDGLSIADAPIDGVPVDVAAVGSALLIATRDAGVYRLEAGEWTQYTLGDAAPSVTSLAVGADVWVRASTGIVRLSSTGAQTTLQRYTAVGTGALAVDKLGDVYGETDGGLSRSSSGTVRGDVATFQSDVLPWIDSHCATCHSNQTQDFRDVEVFRAVAEPALERVRSGDMPRCTGGVRCPPESNLPPEDYAVLERWIRAGLPQ